MPTDPLAQALSALHPISSPAQHKTVAAQLKDDADRAERAYKLFVDAFFQGYVAALLWSEEPDDQDEDEGVSWEPKNLSAHAYAQLSLDVHDFLEKKGAYVCLLAQADVDDRVKQAEDAGHDFALTRNDHGAGFWDGCWPEPQASELTKLSKACGERNLYEAAGKIHVQ